MVLSRRSWEIDVLAVQCAGRDWGASLKDNCRTALVSCGMRRRACPVHQLVGVADTPTQTCPAISRRRSSGDTGSCLRDVLCGLLQRGTSWSSKSIMNKLQRVLNAAARVVSGTRKYDRGLTTLIHADLHWLDVPDRAPKYLVDCCTTVSDVVGRCTRLKRTPRKNNPPVISA